MVTASIQVSTGSTVQQDGTQVPTYLPAQQVQVQAQSLTYNDLVQVEGLNLQGVKRKLYLNGKWDGLVRVAGKGGDIVTMPNGDVYLVVLVLEYWETWTALAVVLQNGS